MCYAVALGILLTVIYYRNFLENKLLPYLEDAPLTDTRTSVYIMQHFHVSRDMR